LIETDFFEELDRFNFLMRKRVSTVYAGARRSIRYGKGIGIVGYREYMPGDDIKTIDWRLYARTEKLYIRQYEEEKNLTAHILLDASKSMEFKSGKFSKFDYAAMLATGFAYIVTKENEKFGISTFSEDVNIMPTKRGTAYLMGMIDYLNNLKLAGKTNLARCIEEYIKVITSKSLVIVISDFLDKIESINAAIYRLASHDLILVQVLDQQEWDVELEGDVKLYDLETAKNIKTYISPRFKEEYLHRLQEHIHAIAATSSRVGAEFYTFNTNKPIFDAFFEVMVAR
jgi:uncharacterized protein (DUF58 family)